MYMYVIIIDKTENCNFIKQILQSQIKKMCENKLQVIWKIEPCV